MDMKEVRQIAIGVARAAGQRLRQGLLEPKAIDRKSSAVDLVTEHDRATQDFITSQLSRAFPDHVLVGEEGSLGEPVRHQPAGTYVWHIDPLDGTNNFAHGIPVFAVSLALYEGDRPLVGVVYDPMRDECFSAAAGRGVTLATAEATAQLRVSPIGNLLESLLATGYPYDRQNTAEDNLAQTRAFLKRAQGLRCTGSAALDLAYVAAGRLDGYWEFKLSSWDVAAGALLLLEAGGMITDLNGQPFRLRTTNSVVASNGLIHPAMLEVLAHTIKEPSAG